MSASGQRDKRVANGAYIASVTSSDDDPGMWEVTGEVRKSIAATWLAYFHGAS
jgi:hypothetical protein